MYKRQERERERERRTAEHTEIDRDRQTDRQTEIESDLARHQYFSTLPKDKDLFFFFFFSRRSITLGCARVSPRVRRTQ